MVNSNTSLEYSNNLYNILKNADSYLREKKLINNNSYSFKIRGSKININTFKAGLEVILNPTTKKNFEEKVVGTIIYGKELKEFNKYDLQTRKEILDSYNSLKYPGILGIVKKKIELPREMLKKGIPKEEYTSKYENLEKKINLTFSIKEDISKVSMNENTFIYLNSLIDVYKTVFPQKNLLNLDEYGDFKQFSKYLSYINGRIEVTPMDSRTILETIYMDKFKGLNKYRFFETVQNKYWKSIKKIINDKIKMTEEDIMTLFPCEESISQNEYSGENRRFENNYKNKTEPITQAQSLKEMILNEKIGFDKVKVSQYNLSNDEKNKLYIVEHNFNKISSGIKKIKERINNIDYNPNLKEKSSQIIVNNSNDTNDCNIINNENNYNLGVKICKDTGFYEPNNKLKL